MTDYKLDTKKLDEILQNLRPKAGQIVEKWGTKITSDAAKMAPVDTGTLRNSLLSESRMREQLLFILQDGVEYGIFQELGTSRMSAQPFVVPSIEMNEKPFVDAFAELFK
jgi:HK97 gp10 family phage protein